MTEKEYTIEGMSCAHCIMSVRKSLEKISGLEVVDVTIGKARVRVDEKEVSESRVERAINEAGYAMVHS